MSRNFFSWLALVLLAAGCAAPSPAPGGAPLRTAGMFPPEALITQRGLLTARGRQIPLTGYVARSEMRGLRLVMTESFGAVLADVLVKPDGHVFVMQAKPPFRPAWVEKYIAADLRCVFGGSNETNCPARMLSPTHFVIQRRWYQLDLQTVEVKPGEQPATMFESAEQKKK